MEKNVKCPIHGLEEENGPCPKCVNDTLFEVVDGYQEREDEFKRKEPWIMHKSGCHALLGIVRGLDGRPIVPNCTCGLHKVMGKVGERLD